MAEINNHGYDVEFVTPQSDDITCTICICTLREPVQANPCGHRFCKGCIENLRKSIIGPLICPNDQGEIQVFADIGRQREILNLRVKCTNNRNGCSWTGELRSLEDHTHLCGNETIKCENVRCNEVLQRHRMILHIKSKCQYRIVQCQYCFEEYVYINKKIHEDGCNEFPLKCVNGCEEHSIARNMMTHHIENDCPKMLHQCQFKTIGCNATGTKASLQEHMKANLSEHLCSAVNTLEKYGECFNVFENALKEQSDQLEEQKGLINKLNQLLTEQSNQLITQSNQLGEQKTKTMTQDLQIKELSEKINLQISKQSNEHTYSWSITDFRNKFQIAKNNNNEILSKSFYCLQGYKGQLEVYLNGHGDSENLHVSVFFCILKDRNDNGLCWPFKGILKFTVIGNDDNKIEEELNTSRASKRDIRDSYMKPTTIRNIGHGFDLIPHQDINKYIVNDTVTVNVDVTFS